MGLAGFPEKDGNMILKEKKRTITVRGLKITYNSLYYFCPETKHHYTTTEIDTENYSRALKAENKINQKQLTTA